VAEAVATHLLAAANVTASNANRAARGIDRTRIEDLRFSPATSHDSIPGTDVQLARLSDASQGTE
jgi:hypothetical protein